MLFLPLSMVMVSVIHVASALDNVLHVLNVYLVDTRKKDEQCSAVLFVQ